jgi:putative spermidine/putrescine transport system ATP-binding protein
MDGSVPAVVLDGGLEVLINSAGTSRRGEYVCLRPENVIVGDAADKLDNSYDGVITEALYTAGSVRYRITTLGGSGLVSRILPHTGFTLYSVGTRVKVGWSKNDVCIIE